MAISLNQVSKTKKVAKKKKTAKKTTKSGETKKAKSTRSTTAKSAKNKKSSSKKTRPWQSPEITAVSAAEKAGVLPTAPADAVKSAADAFNESALADSDSQVREVTTGIGFSQKEPASSETRRLRRKQLQDEVVREWLAVAEEAKKKGLDRLPPQIASKVKKSWLGQIQLSPKVKVPIPDFMLTKVKR